MKRTVLKVGKALTPTQELEKVAIITEQGKIKEVVPWSDIPRNEDVLNYPDAIAAPGFVDIHTHGYDGHETILKEDIANFRLPILTRSIWCIEPQGAFFAFLNFSKLQGSSLEIAKRLLHERGVVTVPGSGFGEMGEGFLRISLATKENELIEGLKRIHLFIQRPKKAKKLYILNQIYQK